jgi:hypothetical protein
MKDYKSSITYFGKKGKENTKKVLDIAQMKAKELEITNVIVASTTGYTAKLAAEILGGLNIVVVTHAAGFIEPDGQEFDDQIKSSLELKGVKVLTAQHTFGGVSRAIRKTHGGFAQDEIIANILRVFGQGMKVIFEIAMMAADAGLVSCQEPAIAISGTGRGADFGVVVIPANSFRIFDLKIVEIFCMPSINHPFSREKA